jgi:hypothetical protein
MRISRSRLRRSLRRVIHVARQRISVDVGPLSLVRVDNVECRNRNVDARRKLGAHSAELGAPLVGRRPVPCRASLWR